MPTGKLKRQNTNNEQSEVVQNRLSGTKTQIQRHSESREALSKQSKFLQTKSGSKKLEIWHLEPHWVAMAVQQTLER